MQTKNAIATRLKTLGILTLLLICFSIFYIENHVVRGSKNLISMTNKTVIRYDSQIDSIVSPDAMLIKLAKGFQFLEGPVWVQSPEEILYFSDIPGNTLYSWSPEIGTRVVIDGIYSGSEPPGNYMGSNGLAVNPDGHLVLCEHGNRRIAKLFGDGTRDTMVDSFDGKRLNSPNDIVFHSSGSAFFTDPPYGLTGRDADPKKELAFNGIFRLDPDGSLTLLSTAMSRPNGLAFSPDEQTLYVSNSGWPKEAMIQQFDVTTDLEIKNQQLFFDTKHLIGDTYTGTPDGLKVDSNGNIFSTGPDGVLIINKSGNHLGTIRTNEVAANVGWGDDGSSLYITASTSLYKIKLKTSGPIWRQK